MAKPGNVAVIRYDLAYFGVVTTVVNANTFTATGLAGKGDGTLQDYGIYVLTKLNGTTTAPHHEQRICTNYTSGTGRITHPAFTAALAVGDRVLLLHPSIASPLTIASYPGTTTDDWQAAEENVTQIGGAGIVNLLHSLLLDINALVGNLTVRLYQDINGVNTRCYEEVFSVAMDGPAIWVVPGDLAIHDILTITMESDNLADNGQAVGWEYILEAT